MPEVLIRKVTSVMVTVSGAGTAEEVPISSAVAAKANKQLSTTANRMGTGWAEAGFLLEKETEKIKAEMLTLS